MGDLYHPNNKSWVPDGRHLVRQQDFWYVMLMTTWIVLPWLCTREVPVDIELVRSPSPKMTPPKIDADVFPQPSPKVAVVRFRRGMQQGLLGRISRSAVKEYHAFGIISCVHPRSHCEDFALIARARRQGGPPRQVPLHDLRCARSVAVTACAP